MTKLLITKEECKFLRPPTLFYIWLNNITFLLSGRAEDLNATYRRKSLIFNILSIIGQNTGALPGTPNFLCAGKEGYYVK